MLYSFTTDTRKTYRFLEQAEIGPLAYFKPRTGIRSRST